VGYGVVAATPQQHNHPGIFFRAMSEKGDCVVGGCGAAATTNNRSTFLGIASET
jgi:hypothetical protein